MGMNLQLREQFWIFTRFPFNCTKRLHKPKFSAKVRILFNLHLTSPLKIK